MISEVPCFESRGIAHGKEEINNGILWNLYEPSSRFSERFPRREVWWTKNQDYNDENYSKLRHANTSEHKALGPALPPPPQAESCQSKDSSVLTGE